MEEWELDRDDRILPEITTSRIFNSLLNNLQLAIATALIRVQAGKIPSNSPPRIQDSEICMCKLSPRTSTHLVYEYHLLAKA